MPASLVIPSSHGHKTGSRENILFTSDSDAGAVIRSEQVVQVQVVCR